MILFNATKTLQIDEENTHDICEFSFIESMKMLETFKEKSKDEIENLFKIKNKTLDLTYEYYHNPKTYKAINMYSGIGYRQIEHFNEKYINKNVFILSAMYGIINGNNYIHPYRLDYTYPGLYKKWKELNTNFILENKNTDILILSSNEYTKSIDIDILKKKKNVYELKIIDKFTSVDLKKIRGILFNECMKNEIIKYSNLEKKEYGFFKVKCLNNDLLISKID